MIGLGMKMKNKAPLISLMLMALILVSACAAKANVDDSDGSVDDSAGGVDGIAGELSSTPFGEELVQKSIYITNHMVDKAANEDYMAIMSASEEMVAEAGIYADMKGLAPDRAVVLGFDESAVDKVVGEAAEYGESQIPSILPLLRGRALMLYANAVNAQYGATYLAALSMLQQTEAFQRPADPAYTGYAIVYLVYDVKPGDGGNDWKAVSIVSFSDSQEGTMIALAGVTGSKDNTLAMALYDDENVMFENLRMANSLLYGAFIFPEDGVSCAVYEDIQ